METTTEGKIEELKIKNGVNKNGKPFVQYTIKVNGDYYATLDQEIGDLLRDGSNVRFSYKTNEFGGKTYRNLVHLMVLSTPEVLMSAEDVAETIHPQPVTQAGTYDHGDRKQKSIVAQCLAKVWGANQIEPSTVGEVWEAYLAFLRLQDA